MTVKVLAILLLAASATGHAQQSDIRIRAARVVDGTGQVLPNATVVVRGSRISAIESAGARPPDIDLPPADNDLNGPILIRGSARREFLAIQSCTS